MRDVHGDVVMKDKRTYKDRSEYLIKAVYARRKKVRVMAVEYKGGNVRTAVMIGALTR